MADTEPTRRHAYYCVRCGWVHDGPDGSEDVGPGRQIPCPNCGHHEAERQLYGSDIAWIVGQVLHMPLAEVQATHQPGAVRKLLQELMGNGSP